MLNLIKKFFCLSVLFAGSIYSYEPDECVLCSQTSEIVLKINSNLWRDNLGNISNHDYWYPNKNQVHFIPKSEGLREHVHLYMSMHKGVSEYHYNLMNSPATNSSSPEIFFSHFEWINDSSFINSLPIEQASVYFNQLFNVNGHHFVDHLIKPNVVLDEKGNLDYIEGKSFLAKQGQKGIYYRLYILPLEPSVDNFGNLHYNVYFILFKNCYKSVCPIMVADILNNLDSKCIERTLNRKLPFLHEAIETSDWHKVEALIDAKDWQEESEIVADEVNMPYCILPTSTVLLEAFRTTPNQRPSNSFGTKPIQHLSPEKRIELIKKLIQGGLNLDLKVGREYRDFDWRDKLILKGVALYGKDLTSIDSKGLLTQGQNLMLHAVMTNYPCFLKRDLIETLIDHGVDINFRHPNNQTTLIQFVLQMPDLETVQLLLDLGSDVSDIDCFSWLGFPKSAEEFKEVVLLLLSSGANASRTSERASSHIYPKVSQLDQCLRNVIAVSDTDVRNKEFKAEIIPFLCDLGAQMPVLNTGAKPIR